MPRFTIGLDYGTGSVRAVLINTTTGQEIAAAVDDYPHGVAGVVISPKDPNLARQHPADYEAGAIATVKAVLKAGAKKKIKPEQIIGIGVDTTGSTPIPVDANGTPLAFDKRFKKNPNAYAWLWKDHTSHLEAEEITAAAGKLHPEYLAKIGNRYSSEWYWAKILHCAPRRPGGLRRRRVVGRTGRLHPRPSLWNHPPRSDSPRHLRRRAQGLLPHLLGRVPRRRISQDTRPATRTRPPIAPGQGLHHRRSRRHALCNLGEKTRTPRRHTRRGGRL